MCYDLTLYIEHSSLMHDQECVSHSSKRKKKKVCVSPSYQKKNDRTSTNMLLSRNSKKSWQEKRDLHKIHSQLRQSFTSYRLVATRDPLASFVRSLPDRWYLIQTNSKLSESKQQARNTRFEHITSEQPSSHLTAGQSNQDIKILEKENSSR